MGIDTSLLAVIICVTFIILLLIFIIVCEVQEQRLKCKRAERVSRKERTYYLQGIQQAENYLQKHGFDEVVEYSNKKIPINHIDAIDSGWVDYIEYYRSILSSLKEKDASKIHAEITDAINLQKKLAHSKQELNKYGFKENIRW